MSSTAAPTTDLTDTLPSPSDFATRMEHGRAARRRIPRSAHEGWVPASDRVDDYAAFADAVASGRLPGAGVVV
ncbi:hypothetical protein MRBLMI12_000610 [Microbacterium sp. LMI12-1-1.1]|uniref:hypothetical protein n=1 Tax=Microbacterium sp. LMI12-1-1.1 TaxID=3135225 RepID=UPI00343145F9